MHILLTGAFSSLNKGDEARVKCAAQMIKSRFPDVRMSWLTSYPERDRRIYERFGLETVNKFKYFCLDDRKYTRQKKTMEFVLVLLGALFNRCSRGKGTWFRSDEFKKYDIFLDLSGESLSDYYGSWSLLRTLHPMVMGLLLNKPVIIFAQSIGPFRSPLIRRLAVGVLNQVDLITVRDEASMKFLAEYGVSTPRIEFTADPAFLLGPPDIVSLPSINRSLQQARDRGGVQIGLCVSRGGYRYAIGADRNLQTRVQAYFNTVGKVLDKIADDLSATLWFVPHVLEPGQDETEVYEYFRSTMKNPNSLRLVPPHYNCEEMKAIIGRFDLFISSRMHASIAALSSFVPTVTVAYSHKLLSLMKMLDQEAYACTMATVTYDELLQKIYHAWENKDQVRTRLSSAVSEITRKSWKNVDALEAVLGDPYNG